MKQSENLIILNKSDKNYCYVHTYGNIFFQWHLGFVAKEYTPMYRGFDSFLGFVGGKDDYWDHSRYEGTANPVSTGKLLLSFQEIVLEFLESNFHFCIVGHICTLFNKKVFLVTYIISDTLKTMKEDMYDISTKHT